MAPCDRACANDQKIQAGKTDEIGISEFVPVIDINDP